MSALYDLNSTEFAEIIDSKIFLRMLDEEPLTKK